MKMGEVQESRMAVLKEQLATVDNDMRKAKEMAAQAQREASRCEKLKGMIGRQLEAAMEEAAGPPTHGIIISDHAVVRYLERKYGLSMDNVRAEMLDLKTQASIAFLNGGAGKIKMDDLIYVVDKNVVITVKPTA